MTDRAPVAQRILHQRAFADALRVHLHVAPGWTFDSIGRSMHPTIPGGSALAVEPLPSSLAVGDLLAFVTDRRVAVCCHRVVAVRADGAALTRGDNNSWADGWIEPERHVGVVRRYRTGGRWYDARSGVTPGRVRRFAQRAARFGQRVRLAAREGRLLARVFAAVQRT